MSVARWGYWGKPVLFFPTGGGDFLDCERFLMTRALQPLIDAGRIKLYAIDSLSPRSWINPNANPAERSAFQGHYDRYLVEELMPYVRFDCGNSPLPAAVTGASIGAYLAFSAASRHPWTFDLMIGMSGTYQMTRRMKEHWDLNYYYHDPCQFLPNLDESEQLSRLRENFFFLGLGQRFENPTYTRAAPGALASKGIPHHVEIWGHDSGHDWPTWRSMLPMALDRLVK